VSAATIGGKHPGFRESVGLRGQASERRPRPVRDAERGSSPPGKPGATGHARRGGSSPGFRGSRLVTKGMLGCLRRRGARKKPKRLRALRFRTVGPWLYLGGFQGNLGLAVGGESAFGRTSHGALPPARFRRPTPTKDGVDTGSRTESGQTLGDHWPREGHVVSRRARRRSRGSCPYVVVSLQMSIGGLAQRSPSPKRKRPKGLGGRGERGPGLRMYQSCEVTFCP